GLASSANRPLINTALSTAGIAELFRVTRSTEEVGRGKPAPDIYLDVADELGVAPQSCAGVEDSTNGLKALRAAGMRVIAAPNPTSPPDPAVLATADAIVNSLDELTPATVLGAEQP